MSNYNFNILKFFLKDNKGRLLFYHLHEKRLTALDYYNFSESPQKEKNKFKSQKEIELIKENIKFYDNLNKHDKIVFCSLMLKNDLLELDFINKNKDVLLELLKNIKIYSEKDSSLWFSKLDNIKIKTSKVLKLIELLLNTKKEKEIFYKKSIQDLTTNIILFLSNNDEIYKLINKKITVSRIEKFASNILSELINEDYEELKPLEKGKYSILNHDSLIIKDIKNFCLENKNELSKENLINLFPELFTENEKYEFLKEQLNYLVNYEYEFSKSKDPRYDLMFISKSFWYEYYDKLKNEQNKNIESPNNLFKEIDVYIPKNLKEIFFELGYKRRYDENKEIIKSRKNKKTMLFNYMGLKKGSSLIEIRSKLSEVGSIDILEWISMCDNCSLFEEIMCYSNLIFSDLSNESIRVDKKKAEIIFSFMIYYANEDLTLTDQAKKIIAMNMKV